MGAAVGDVDEDGWPDVFVANDTEPNFLFRNRGDGTFEDIAATWGVAVNQFGSPVSAMGADLRDVDNDGRLDLFVTDLANEGFLLFRHARTHFEDVSNLSGITRSTLPYAGWSNPVADYNNDGWKDLFSANGHVTDNIERIQGRSYRQGNALLLNRGDGTIRRRVGENGPRPDQARRTSRRGRRRLRQRRTTRSRRHRAWRAREAVTECLDVGRTLADAASGGDARRIVTGSARSCGSHWTMVACS